jgi:hypothetical protein
MYTTAGKTRERARRTTSRKSLLMGDSSPEESGRWPATTVVTASEARTRAHGEQRIERGRRNI